MIIAWSYYIYQNLKETQGITLMASGGFLFMDDLALALSNTLIPIIYSIALQNYILLDKQLINVLRS